MLTRVAKQLKQIRIAYFPTEEGWIGAAATKDGLVAVNLPASTRAAAAGAISRLLPQGVEECTSLPPGPFDETALTRLGQELAAYFAGKPVAFDTPIDWESCRYTPFQEKALRECYQVGYGRTVTYGAIAGAIGKPGAARAVGMAMHINRTALVVP
jgi:methylated-DNA-[protein]-cysteine S-methyltransferase